MRYNVTLRFQFPAWNEVDGITYHDVEADSKAEAIKLARRMGQRDGHTDGALAGLQWWKATPAEETE